MASGNGAVSYTHLGVERHGAGAAEMSGAHLRRRLAAPGEAEVFQKHCERNGETVVDRGVAHVRDRDARGFFRARNRDLGAELAQRRRCRDMLMGMRLRAAAHADARRCLLYTSRCV